MKDDCLELAWRIDDEYHLDGFFGLIIEGRQRIGKSSYASQGIAEAFGDLEYAKEYVKCRKPEL